jgi:hypothetical protein
MSIKQLLGEEAAGVVKDGNVGEGCHTTTVDKEKLQSGFVVSAMGLFDATSRNSH